MSGTDGRRRSGHSSVPISAATRARRDHARNHEREHAFGEAEVRLLQTVAASMGVALENARLFDETKEALERQTATAEILKVISGHRPTSSRCSIDRSRGIDRLCAADRGAVPL